MGENQTGEKQSKNQLQFQKSNPVNSKIEFFFLGNKKIIKKAENETDPIEQFAAVGREDVDILRGHKKAEEAHGKDLSNGEDRDFDGGKE